MISVFDLFSIGIGPSSSHTVGPMTAAYDFVNELSEQELQQTHYLIVEIYGSLAFTGIGHGTDNAILSGLEGNLPDTVDPDNIVPRCQEIIDTEQLNINQSHIITFKKNLHFIFNKKDQLPFHTNAMTFRVYDKESQLIKEATAYSIGGGFVVKACDINTDQTEASTASFEITTATKLLNYCKQTNKSIADVIMENELTLRSKEAIHQQLLKIYKTMQQCIEKGARTSGILPGGLNVKRRAATLHDKLVDKGKPVTHEHTDSMNWLNMYAIAVNEENAAGGRIVTAPTNGAAGILPAVLHYYINFFPHSTEKDIIDFLLTAGAIAILFKKNASISGAEVGCQGEVGVACSMAAGALTAVLGGTLDQIENAAEIGIEHHLGMTCDPVGGLVQIPCIERNAMGAVKAVNAARLALSGDGTHYISLDKAIITMKKTGEDMNSVYKETSLGGLAANTPEC